MFYISSIRYFGYWTEMQLETIEDRDGAEFATESASGAESPGSG